MSLGHQRLPRREISSYIGAERGQKRKVEIARRLRKIQSEVIAEGFVYVAVILEAKECTLVVPAHKDTRNAETGIVNGVRFSTVGILLVDWNQHAAALVPHTCINQTVAGLELKIGCVSGLVSAHLFQNTGTQFLIHKGIVQTHHNPGRPA